MGCISYCAGAETTQSGTKLRTTTTIENEEAELKMAEQPEIESTNKQLISIGFQAFELLSLHLRPGSIGIGKDWRSLAAMIGFTVEEINWLNMEPDPVISMLNRWIAKYPDTATTDNILSYLREMRRLDTVTDLQQFIGKAVFHEQVALTQRTKRNSLNWEIVNKQYCGGDVLSCQLREFRFEICVSISLLLQNLPLLLMFTLVLLIK